MLMHLMIDLGQPASDSELLTCFGQSRNSPENQDLKPVSRVVSNDLFRASQDHQHSDH